MLSCSDKNSPTGEEQVKESKIMVKSFEINSVDVESFDGSSVSFIADGNEGLFIEHYEILSAMSSAEELVLSQNDDKILIREVIDENLNVNGIAYCKVKSHIAPLVKGKHYTLTLKGHRDRIICKVEFDYSETLELKTKVNEEE